MSKLNADKIEAENIIFANKMIGAGKEFVDRYRGESNPKILKEASIALSSKIREIIISENFEGIKLPPALCGITKGVNNG
jgi:hypothetical protein